MTDASDLVPCPICGEPIRAVAKKCRFCGEDLERYAKRQRVQVEERIYAGAEPLFYSAGQIVLLVFLCLLFVLPGLIFLLVRLIASHSCTWVITTQRLGIQTGLLSKGGENVELFRVDDFGLNSPWGHRLMGWDVLVFKSSDRTAPVREVLVPHARAGAIAEQVRQAIFDQRELRGIMTLAHS